MSKRLPMEVQEAKKIGLIDQICDQFCDQNCDLKIVSEFKKESRLKDEFKKPLHKYREEELVKMKENFYGFDPSFHQARYNFVRHIPKSKTPLYIAIHRV